MKLETVIAPASAGNSAEAGAAGILGVIDPITPKMIAAGIHELREFWLGSDLGEIAKAVYMAMEYERRDSKSGRLGN